MTTVAADAPPAATAASFNDWLTSAGISLSGLVSSSFYRSSGYNSFHQFDIRHDSFQLDQAAFTIAYQPKEGFGAVVNLTAGEDMRVLNTAEQNLDRLSSNTFNVTQAYAQYASGPLTLMAGKFLTLAGAEVLAPTGNTNFSRSLLFYTEPMTHTGLRLSYAVSDQLTVFAGMNNGWNTTSTSYGSKTGEFGAAFSPAKALSLTAQAYVGRVPQYESLRTLVDSVLTYTATDALTLVLSADWGEQDQRSGPKLQWTGIAGYVTYFVHASCRISLRGEWLDDKDGFNTGTRETLEELTATVAVTPARSFELRLEGRYDHANRRTFLSSSSAGMANFENHQSEVALQALFKF